MEYSIWLNVDNREWTMMNMIVQQQVFTVVRLQMILLCASWISGAIQFCSWFFRTVKMLFQLKLYFHHLLSSWFAVTLYKMDFISHKGRPRIQTKSSKKTPSTWRVEGGWRKYTRNLHLPQPPTSPPKTLFWILSQILTILSNLKINWAICVTWETSRQRTDGPGGHHAGQATPPSHRYCFLKSCSSNCCNSMSCFGVPFLRPILNVLNQIFF